MTTVAMNPRLDTLLKAFAALFATALLLTVLAAPAGAAPEVRHEPVLVSKKAASIVAGAPTWVNVLWVADGSVDDFIVTASAKGVDVEYSPTTRDHAGPMHGYELDDLETDFTALKLTVPEDFEEGNVKLELEASWTQPDGESRSEQFKVKVPVVHFDGNRDWQLVEDRAPLGTGWVDVAVFGMAPSSEDLRFTVADTGGVDVTLPQVDWTGPHHDSTLVAGESDVLRFYIEPGSLSETHTFVFDAEWSRNGEPKAETVSFTVVAG